MDGVYTVDEIVRIITPILKNYGIRRAYLFGSYARGDALPGSDIDLRIDGGKIKSMFGLGGLYNDLTEALKKPVDLVTTEALNHRANAEQTDKFRSHIQEDERLIYEAGCGEHSCDKVEQPNQETIAALLEAERIVYDLEVKSYSDVEEALRELKK